MLKGSPSDPIAHQLSERLAALLRQAASLAPDANLGHYLSNLAGDVQTIRGDWTNEQQVPWHRRTRAVVTT